MNKIILQGILKNIKYSHTIQGVDYDKATLLVQRDDKREDLIDIKFKKFSNIYKENQLIEFEGNIRTFSQQLKDKNKVQVYVFTYFDIPDYLFNLTEDTEPHISNYCELDGKICKKNELRTTKEGKSVINFILANNLVTETQNLNCYIPCVAWGKNAKYVNSLKIGDKIQLQGQLQSREYKKKLNDSDFEVRVAHEVSIKIINKIED